MGAEGGAAACNWALISSEHKASQSKGKYIEKGPKKAEETATGRLQEGRSWTQADTAQLSGLARL